MTAFLRTDPVGISQAQAKILQQQFMGTFTAAGLQALRQTFLLSGNRPADPPSIQRALIQRGLEGNPLLINDFSAVDLPI